MFNRWQLHGKLEVTIWTKKSKQKVEYNNLTKEIRKRVVKNVENEWIRNNWERTTVQCFRRATYRTCFFNMVSARACECYRTSFPSRLESLPFLHVTWLNPVITWHTITRLGGNAYQNERVSLLHFKWPNHPKVIKATTHKLALMKGSCSYRARDLWLRDILINEERQITTFAKALKY